MDKLKRGKAVIGVIAVLLCGTVYLCTNYRSENDSMTVAENFRSAGDAGAPSGNLESADAGRSGESADAEKASEGADSQATDAPIYIHVCGAVKNPGVYKFDREPRVIEAVKRAGGFTKKADRTSVNLAGTVTDGTQLVIAKKSAGKNTSSGQDLSNQPQDDSVHAGQAATGPDSTGKVNINTATREELMTLSGIGEAKADLILSYREEHGAFQKIEDIMNISGIKEGVFGQIKDSITV